MTLDKRIKVIKRDERRRRDSLPAATRPEGEQDIEQPRPAVAKNNAATVVTNWVHELRRQRKGGDARREFESLFHKAA